MTAGELYTYLGSCHPDTPIVLAKDAEGNDFSPASEVEFRRYVATTTWSGELIPNDEPNNDARPAIVIWPVN